MRPVVVNTMDGLGDCIYTRPLIRAESERTTVYVHTPWPELYQDLGVRFLQKHSIFRTQQKNLARQSATRWAAPPRGAYAVSMGYGSNDIQKWNYTIAQSLERFLPLRGAAFVFDLPSDLPACKLRTRKPIALVRPVTVRKEWPNYARNCEPEYVREASAQLADAGYYVVSVADVDGNAEWLVEPAPVAHKRFERGELAVRDLLALVRAASVVVGPVGWIVPASIAAGTPLIVIGGGAAGINNPETLTDPRMDTSRVEWILPPDPCRCVHNLHRCQKTIPDFGNRFRAAMDKARGWRLAA